jgi:two-component system response regulator FixJ
MTQPLGTVFIVDDTTSIREWLTESVTTVGLKSHCFEDGLTFLENYDELRTFPACAVVDLRMPYLSGLDVLLAVNKKTAGLPVLILTAHGDIDSAVEAMKHGAFDFVEKPTRTQKLLESIQRALSHDYETYEHRRDAASGAEKLSMLTAKEREVFDAVVAGVPNKVIASDLSISEKAVENRRARMVKKLGASSVADLVRISLTP